MEKRSPTLVDMSRIERAHSDAGGHWFEPRTKRFFRSRVAQVAYQGPGGTFFVSSERGPNGVRRWSVRAFDFSNPRSVETIGDFQGYSSRGSADRAARRFALDGRPGH